MILSSRRISDKKFLVSCADPFRHQAEWLLEMLEKIEQDRGRGFLEDGASIQVGWSMVTIRREGDALVVAEPNFSGNPFRETNTDLTCTLSVQAEQNSVLKALAVKGVPVRFQDKVIISKGSLEKPRIYLERQVPEKGDSGWYIGEVDQPQSELKAIYSYQLLPLRPALLKVLALPVGYVVVFENDRIEAIVNEQNEQLRFAGIT